MSSGHSIKKCKRSKSSNDVNNSFVKNVTSRVSSLLPSTITKWFGSPSTSNANGSAAVADSSDSSTEDEAPENSIIQPPAKRMCLRPPPPSDYPETKCTSTNTEPIETFSVVQSPLGRSTFRTETNYIPTPLHSPNDEATITEQDKDTPEYKLQSSLSSVGSSVIKKRKSIFDVSADEEPIKKVPSSHSIRDHSQPYYKQNLLGSPFYSGQTRYGGMANFYTYPPNIKHKTLVRHSANKDNIATVSQTARRIMDLLENYSSPVTEAKRLSQFVTSSKTSLDNITCNNTNNTYKTRELYVPSIAKILRLKQKSRLMVTTNAARQIIASNSSTPMFTPYPHQRGYSNGPKETTQKLTTKIKARVTLHNRDDNSVNDDNSTTPIHLPTAVLQIDQNNLPKFTLGTSIADPLPASTAITAVETSANISSTTTSTINVVSNSVPKCVEKDNTPINTSETDSKSHAIINDNSYNFSNPIMVHDGTVENPLPLPAYTFGSPGRWTVENSKESRLKLSLDQDQSLKCVDCENMTNKIEISVTKANATNSLKWKCQDCWVNNDEDVDKCVCCGGMKPNSSTVTSKSDNIENEWKCDVCWVKNKCSADKCVACTGAKPSSTQSNSNDILPKTSIVNMKANDDITFKNILNSQTDKWECSHCLVHNEKHRNKCVCCDGEQPGTIKELAKNSFNFGTNYNTTFKFGIDQNILEKNPEFSDSKQLETTVKESETNNNIVTKPSSFTFGVPNNKISDNNITEETIAEETPKPTFTFGISKPLESTARTPTNLFNNPVLSGSKFPDSNPPTNSIETDEKVQEVPNIEEPNSAVVETIKKPVGLFGIPLLTSSKTTAMPALITFGPTDKITNSATLLPITTTAADAKVPQSTFSFSASNIKPTPQLFATAVTTASTTSVSFTGIQATSSSSISFFQNSGPVHTSSLSFFPKSEATPSSLSLFTKTETTTTTVTPSALSNAPVFSFGGNTQNTLPSTEKPKFSFTFANKSEIPSLFNLPTAKAGNILPGTGLPSSNSVSDNIITGGNGLATGNSVGGNGLSSNPLSSGLLTGPAKKENILWSSNNDYKQISSIKMSLGNNLEPGINNLPAIQSGNLFTGQPKKENMWTLNSNTSNDPLGTLKLPTGNSLDSGNNSVAGAPGRMFSSTENSMFSVNAGANDLQKPATFAFGSSIQFNSNNVVTPTPVFGAPPQPSQNIFGMSSQHSNNQQNLFSSIPSSTNIFGAQPQVGNSAPSMGMFGTPSAAPTATPAFGTPNSSIPTFEATPLNSVPTPTFNFGAQQTTGVFGFGQQQLQSQGGVYNFGAPAAASPQRPFSIGTASGPNAIGRRVVRKAVRRTTQR